MCLVVLGGHNWLCKSVAVVCEKEVTHTLRNLSFELGFQNARSC